MEHGADVPAVRSGLTEAERAASPATAHPALERFLAGSASTEVTIMQLLLACGGLEPVLRCLDALRGRREFAELVRTGTADRDGLERTAALVAAGLAEERNGVDAIRDQFDRAVALAPEASVA